MSAWALRVLRPHLRRFDVQVSRWSKSYDFQRIRYLRDLGVDALVDVGANEGQYGADVRAYGYSGRLLSVEPQAQAYVRLVERASQDSLWDSLQCGLGAESGEAELKLSANGWSSSILPILDSHVEAEPESRYRGAERIVLRTLDSVVAEWGTLGSRIGVKLDVQGFEAEVLRGAANTLPSVWFLECELSLTPLYKGQLLYDEMIWRLGNEGFSLVNICRGFSDPKTGRVLQIDGVFLRTGEGASDRHHPMQQWKRDCRPSAAGWPVRPLR